MDKFRNQIFNHDIFELLRTLPDNSVDMVYSDPDYNVGINYAGKKYTQKWEEYIEWYTQLIKESMRVLKPSGNLFTINYPRQNAYLWVKCLDAIAFNVSEYVWIYNTNVGHSRKKLTTAHRTILHATKTKKNNFYKEHVAQPYKNPEDRRIRQRIADGHTGRMPYSWIYANLVKNVSKDKTYHACQIPLNLYELLLKASTCKGDIALIHFGGSGSEIIRTCALERDFISCEIHPEYYRMIRERLAHDGSISLAYRLEFIKNRIQSKSRTADSMASAYAE